MRKYSILDPGSSRIEHRAHFPKNRLTEEFSKMIIAILTVSEDGLKYQRKCPWMPLNLGSKVQNAKLTKSSARGGFHSFYF